MKSFAVQNFGPIRKANIEFGDLTVLVGPQASGKSLLVQLFKAVQDAGAIHQDLKAYGYDWMHSENRSQDYCSTYFGGGLDSIIQSNTVIQKDNKRTSVSALAKSSGARSKNASVFLIPAQRVLVLQDGWPKPFMAYAEGDPYSMRRFSESLRLLMEQRFGRTESIFPQPKQLKAELKTLIDDAIYIGSTLKVDTGSPRKRIVLSPMSQEASLPFSAWSAGQREFTPLLLGLYWLMPPSAIPRRDSIDTVVIEEPEMGLHPQAILTFGLLVLELLHRDYRVIISTHSPIILDLVWAINELKSAHPKKIAYAALQQIFSLPKMSQQVQKVFSSALVKTYRTYYFERQSEGVVVRDISSLDPAADDSAIAGWGGLSGFSGHIADAVGRAIQAGA